MAFEVSGTRAGFDACARAVGEGGRVVCCGYYPGTEYGLDSRDLVGRELTVMGTRGSTLPDAMAALAAVESGEIRPPIDSVTQLHQSIDAFARLTSGLAVGRVLVTS